MDVTKLSSHNHLTDVQTVYYKKSFLFIFLVDFHTDVIKIEILKSLT